MTEAETAIIRKVRADLQEAFDALDAAQSEREAWVAQSDSLARKLGQADRALRQARIELADLVRA